MSDSGLASRWNLDAIESTSSGSATRIVEEKWRIFSKGSGR